LETLITIEDVTTAGNLKLDILSGYETNVIIMEFHDAHALELLRRADLDHNWNEWIRNEALRALRVEDHNLLDPRKPVDLRAARCALYYAFCDDPRPNPEHSNLQVMIMMIMGMDLSGGAPLGGDTKNTEALLLSSKLIVAKIRKMCVHLILRGSVDLYSNYQGGRILQE